MSDFIKSTLSEQEQAELLMTVTRAAIDTAPNLGTAASALIAALASLLSSLDLPMSDVDILAEEIGRKLCSLARELRRINTQ